MESHRSIISSIYHEKKWNEMNQSEPHSDNRPLVYANNNHHEIQLFAWCCSTLKYDFPLFLWKPKKKIDYHINVQQVTHTLTNTHPKAIAKAAVWFIRMWVLEENRMTKARDIKTHTQTNALCNKRKRSKTMMPASKIDPIISRERERKEPITLCLFEWDRCRKRSVIIFFALLSDAELVLDFFFFFLN